MAIIMVSIITIYTNATVTMTMTMIMLCIMIMTMVVIKKFTHYMSIATKTMTKFLKRSLKRQFLLLFQDDKKKNIKV